jgi:hypothetical protein
MSRRIELCLAAMAALGFSASVQAGDACSLRGTAGTYIVRCTGYNVAAPGTNIPVAVLLLEKRAKDGDLSGSGTISIGVPPPGAPAGVTTTIAPTAFTGTAEVNPDCTGTENLSQSIGGGKPTSAHFSFIVGTDGRQIESVNTDPVFVLTCTDTRVDHD